MSLATDTIMPSDVAITNPPSNDTKFWETLQSDVNDLLDTYERLTKIEANKKLSNVLTDVKTTAGKTYTENIALSSAPALYPSAWYIFIIIIVLIVMFGAGK